MNVRTPAQSSERRDRTSLSAIHKKKECGSSRGESSNEILEVRGHAGGGTFLPALYVPAWWRRHSEPLTDLVRIRALKAHPRAEKNSGFPRARNHRFLPNRRRC